MLGVTVFKRIYFRFMLKLEKLRFKCNAGIADKMSRN